MWFEFGQYSIVDDVAWLCLSEKIILKEDESKSKKFHTLTLTYSSLFCLTISIVSLIVLLCIYSITASLRNLPGKNPMLLCCVLALAQFLWLLQGQTSKLHKMCIIFSHLLHFLFLASFSSATSIALLHFQGRRNEKRARGADFVEGHQQHDVKIHTLEFRGSVTFFLRQILTDHILSIASAITLDIREI